MIFGRNILLLFQSNRSSVFIGTYPTLYDTANNKHYVGFESIYEYSRTLNVSIVFSFDK
jgi:hypothetical protein